MGQEVRVALSVVGGLLLVFCGLLYARISGSGLALPDVSLSDPQRLPSRQPAVRTQPTIVPQATGWEELTAPFGSVGSATSPAPLDTDLAVLARREANPHRVSGVELIAAEYPTPDLTNPRATSYVDAPAAEPSSPPAEVFPWGDAIPPLEPTPPAAAAPIRLTVRAQEDVAKLATRAYGSADYERALASLLRDWELPQPLPAGSVLELPSRDELRARYPHLAPGESAEGRRVAGAQGPSGS